MRDFKQQMKAYGDELKSARCPYSEAELDKKIRKALWNAGTRQAMSETQPLADAPRRVPAKWISVAAAACLLAVLLPMGLRAEADNGFRTVKVDGEQVYFACNNGCSPDATIETFQNLLR